MSEREDDFLGRWSRRKADARDGGLKKKSEAPEAPVHKPGRMRTDPLPPKIEPEIALKEEIASEGTLVQEASLREDLNEDQIPAEVEDDEAAVESRTEDAAEAEPEDFEKIDFDGLNYESDYTKFMKSGVPESVRKRALRMLWGSNPILANIDGLNDYDDDFTDAALAVKGLLKTSYKAGSGYLTPEEIDASYSEEARKAGVEPKDQEASETAAQDGEDADGAEAETATAEANPSDETPPETNGQRESQPVRSGDESRPDNDNTVSDVPGSGETDETV